MRLIDLQYDSYGFESRPGGPQGGVFDEKLALIFNWSPPENTVVCHVRSITVISYKNTIQKYYFPTDR